MYNYLNFYSVTFECRSCHFKLFLFRNVSNEICRSKMKFHQKSYMKYGVTPLNLS